MAGGNYAEIKRAVEKPDRAALVFDWGAPPPFFALNFSTKSIHDDAEKMLAGKIRVWRESHPDGRIDLIGHSAGCGVILGALAQLQDQHVRDVVLLAPSVSPTYDLHPALAHIDGTLHVFFSERDTAFLDWRTSHFGTYDRIKTKAAGNVGFGGGYPIVQHAYDPAWQSLGNDGGHFGTLSETFEKQIIAPLLPP